MNVSRCIKESFAVIGKEGSTRDGEGFVQRLWADANAHFSQVAPLAKQDGNGNLIGIWGAMTDFSRTFQPWEEGFSRGAVSGRRRMRRRCPAAGGLDKVGDSQL